MQRPSCTRWSACFLCVCHRCIVLRIGHSMPPRTEEGAWRKTRWAFYSTVLTYTHTPRTLVPQVQRYNTSGDWVREWDVGRVGAPSVNTLQDCLFFESMTCGAQYCVLSKVALVFSVPPVREPAFFQRSFSVFQSAWVCSGRGVYKVLSTCRMWG